MQIQASVHEVCSAAKRESSFFEKKHQKNFCELGALGPGLPLIATGGGD
jgi:hypothetical protein